MKLVERLTRTDADTIVYEGTVTDPTAFTAPWTITTPMKRDDKYEMFDTRATKGTTSSPTC